MVPKFKRTGVRPLGQGAPWRLCVSEHQLVVFLVLLIWLAIWLNINSHQANTHELFLPVLSSYDKKN